MSAWANSLNIKTSTVPVYPIKSMVTMKKPTFPFILKQANEAVEKNALKTEGRQYTDRDFGQTAR